MPKHDLLVALIAGPMYDRLYQALTEFTRAITLSVLTRNMLRLSRTRSWRAICSSRHELRITPRLKKFFGGQCRGAMTSETSVDAALLDMETRIREWH